MIFHWYKTRAASHLPEFCPLFLLNRHTSRAFNFFSNHCNNAIVSVIFFFSICPQDARTDDVLRRRLSAGRRAAARSRTGGETDPGTSIPAPVTFAVVLVHVVVDRPPATGRGQADHDEPVAAREAVWQLAQAEFAAVVGVQQPEINDHHGPRTDRVHAGRADRQGKCTCADMI